MIREEYDLYKNKWKKIQSARVKSGSAEDSFVYAHVRESDESPFYIGIGSNENRPWTFQHPSRSNHHKNVVAKHGTIVKILADNLTWEQTCFWEVRWIKALRGAGYPLVNQVDGGEGAKGLRHTDETKKIIGSKSSGYLLSLGESHPSKRLETRKKISDSMAGKYKGDAHPRFGKKLSQKTKDKISKSLSGPNNPNYGKPCVAALAALKENHPKYWLGKSGLDHPRYEKKQSEETKNKLRDANLGKKASETTRLKLKLLSEGEKNPRAKISERQAQDILDFAETHSEAAAHFNLPYNYVRDIRIGKSWKYLKSSQEI